MAAMQRIAADEELEDSPEAVTKEVFKPYQCRCNSILAQGAVAHAGDIAEASSLSAIPLPPSSYPLFDAYPQPVVRQGKLSQLQLEGVLYACSRHQQILPSGERAGFFIGDGAGVGKGRQIAGVMLDNYARGRRRHLWLSTSTDLHVDATRDVRDLGSHIPVINGCASLDAGTRALGLDKDLTEGVLFLTYSTLISAGRAGRSRLKQVLEWLVGGTNTSSSSKGDDAAAALAAAAKVWDGVLVFDECHKAKNFAPGKEAQSTKVASAVIELQAMLPNARVLYCSATGVSEVGNMAYMARMGLWGPSSAFHDFESFLDSMKKRGVSFMELLAMEMKAAGRYVARGLSFREAEFLQVEAPLRPSKVVLYDAAVQVWQEVRWKLEQAMALSGSENAGVWKTYWSAHQRFFKLLCIDLKLETVLAESKAALAGGMCVVIGLQSTGEAAAEAMGLEPGPLPGFVSPCKELLVRFINQHFPLLKAQSAEAAAAGLPQEAVPACRQMQQQLLAKISALHLPANFLDVLIDELGGPKAVAEMTGRKGRVVRHVSAGGRQQVVYELRAKPDSSEMDSLNVSERDLFMSGKKLVALISDAASTGISLHAVATAGNTARRLHLTVELPWSADKAIQQFGRSHRTNQLSAPVYKLVVSAAGGERRFAAAVARRLQSLGALTRGDRRAAAGVDLSDSNFDSPWGRKSLRRMYDHIVCESTQLPAGVTVSALMKDLLLPPAAAAAEEAAGAQEGGGTPKRQQQQVAETLKLLQAEIPALAVLQKLAAQEAAVAAASAARTAVAAVRPGAAGTPIKQQQQQRGSQGTPQPQQQWAPGSKVVGSDAEEARILAALTGRSNGSNASLAVAGSSGQQQQQHQQQHQLMSSVEVAMAVSELHHELRSCCDMMDIGLGGAPRKDDTVAEDRPKDAGVGSKANSKDGGDVRRFLNRLLGLPLGRQNLLFNYFAATLAAEITAAKAEGRYSEGVSDLQGSSIWLDRPPQLLWKADGSPGTPAAKAAAAAEEGGGPPGLGDALGTWVNSLVVDRGISYEDAQRRLAHEAFPGCSSGFFRSRRPMFNTHVVLLALQRPGLRNAFTIVRPNTGESAFDMERSDLDSKYVPVTPQDAKADWVSIYTHSLTSCMHGATCSNKGHCSVGSRLSEVTILSGAVVRVWGVLESVLDRHAHELHKSERAMRVVRVAFSATKPASATAAPSAASPAAAAKGETGQVSQDVELPEGRSQQQQQQQQQQSGSCQGQPPEGSPQPMSQQQQQEVGSQGRPPQGDQQLGMQKHQQQQQQPQGSASSSPVSEGTPVGSSHKGSKGVSPSKEPAAAAAAGGVAGATFSLVGVRYPAHLLPEVAATLASLQEQAQTTAAIAAAVAANRGLQLGQGFGTQQQLQGLLNTQQQQGLSMSSWWKASLAKTAGAGAATGFIQQPSAAAVAAAAAAGAMNEALGIARVEPPTPVDPKCKERAYRAPKTLFSFYGKAGAGLGLNTQAADAAPAAALSMSAAAGGGIGSRISNGPVHRAASASTAAAAVAAAVSQGASKLAGKGAAGAQSNALLNCFSRMAATQAAQGGAQKRQQQQQHQGMPPAKKQRELSQQQKQRAGQLGLPPAKRPKQQQQQQQQNGSRREQSDCASVICIDSDSDFDAGADAGRSNCAAASAAVAADVLSSRPKRLAAAAAGVQIAAAAAAAAAAGSGAPDEGQGGTTMASTAADSSISAGRESRDVADEGTAGGDGPVSNEASGGSGFAVESEADSADSQDDWEEAGGAVNDAAERKGSSKQQQRTQPDGNSHQQRLWQQQQQQQRGVDSRQEPQTNGGQGQAQRGQHVTPAALELLAGMGFSGMQAERALWVAQGDVQGAVEFCLRG